MNAAAIAVQQQGQHQHIALANLQPSPFNRKRFDKTKLQELTDNVSVQGVLVPLLVRPVSGGKFEIVAGERRWRAAQGAKLQWVPAIVRELTDAQALELQVIENQQREDVHPLEEAEGYERLLKCQKADGSSYSADDIAAKIGKSRGYVYARMKLCALCPEARQAFYDEKLDASRALLIARIGHHDTQRQALKDITKGEYGRGPMAYREAHQHIVQHYMLKLAAAPFDVKDAQLVSKAGDCVKCPKRTGNQADLFGDVKNADVCTDPKCFDDKRQAHYLVAVRQLEAKGQKVVYGDEAKKAFPNWDAHQDYYRDELSERYVPMSGHDYVGHRQVTIRQILGDGYEPLVIQHPSTGKLVEVATRQAVQTALKTASDSKKKAAAGAVAKPAKAKGPDVDEVLTERLAKLIVEKAPKEFGRTWIHELAGLVCEHFSTRDLEAVALAWGWKANAFKSGSYSKRLAAEAAKLSERELILLMFHMVFAIGPYTRAPVLKLFGIDEAKTRALIIEERKAARKKPPEESPAKTVEAPPAKKAAVKKKPAKASPKKKAKRK